MDKLIKTIQTAGKQDLPTQEAMRQFDPSQHDIFDEALRPKKQISKPTGRKDEMGNDVMATTYEEVNRIALPLQKLITKRRVAFMNVGKTQVMSKSVLSDLEQRMLDVVKKIREDNKMQYRETEVATRLMSELEVAKLWYSEALEDGNAHWGELMKGGKFRMRCKILSPKLGDRLFPVFDSFGNLIYFGRGYKARPDIVKLEDVDTEDVKKDVEHFDIYSSTHIMKFSKQDNQDWELTSTLPHSYGKIPVIYYSQNETPWADVQPMIDRLETVISNFGDTNDYNGSPILVAKGEIVGFSSKGERGKTLEISEGADVKYVTWDQAPEAIKLEIDTLIDLIYTCTQTPNISMKEMKGLGGLSGVAFDRVFIDAHLAAQAMIDDVYGECTQRDLNFLKAAAASIDISLKPAVKMDIWADIPPYRINDLMESINMLMAATGGMPVISQKTAVGMSGLVDDPKEEWEQIKNERDTLGKEVEGWNDVDIE